jgi:hypothetical protein
MKRAAIVIGINHYPEDSDFKQLQAAVKAARNFAEWATEMGFEVRPICDEADSSAPAEDGGTDKKVVPVTMTRVKSAVTELVQRTGAGRLDQLVIYFSGHGVNKGFAEYWLLSAAPNDGSEAVNVNGCVDDARYLTGISHIVFISDACRTPAPTIQVQNVTGGSIFPNQQGNFSTAVVDRFYAARPGNPAVEIKDEADYSAFYTDCLLYALSGHDSSALEPYREAGPEIRIVTPRKLKSFLLSELPKRAAALHLRRPQESDSLVESEYPAYLSLFTKRPWSSGPGRYIAPLPEPALDAFLVEKSIAFENVFEDRLAQAKKRAASQRRPGKRKTVRKRKDLRRREPKSSEDLSAALLRNPVTGRERSVVLGKPRLKATPPPELRVLVEPVEEIKPGDIRPRNVLTRIRSDAELLQRALTPIRISTGCGFAVRGDDKVVEAKSGSAKCTISDESRWRQIVTVYISTGVRSHARQAATVLFKLASGRAALLAALPNFVGTATFSRGELANVTYEPALNSPGWYLYDRFARKRLSPLRATIAAATRNGVFRVSRESAHQVAQGLRVLKGVDPTLGLYAAYAYHEAGLIDEVSSVARYMRKDHAQLFDVAMLTRRPRDPAQFPYATVFPPVPLLTQGWSLLESKGIEITDMLDRVRRRLLPSLWTLFDPHGTEVLIEMMANRVL